MLRQRLLLGPVLIAAIILGSWLDQSLDRVPVSGWYEELTGRRTLPPGIVVLLAVAALAWLGALELAALYRQKSIRVSRRVVITFTILGLAMVAFIPKTLDAVTGVALVNTVVAVALVGSLAFNARHREVQGSAAAAGGALLGVAYLGMMFGFMVLIRREWSAWVLLWLITTTKASDIGAYFVGRSIGRHKLIPWLSPGKTWEGAFGGVAFSAGMGALGIVVLGSQWPMGALGGLAFGVALSVVGQIGDLVMSLLKRDAGAKDAGSSLPGFGGILDVLDSVLLAAPVGFWLLRVMRDL
ncbi:MAG: phosphatidate cytidylyltransferase [Phycisphaerales bacterium]|nr:phosphatidate cytidylyltransferase [Phycisphaerales bacterium]